MKISQNSQAQACNFTKKETLAQVFSCEFCEIFKNKCFIENLCCLLLEIVLLFQAVFNLETLFTHPNTTPLDCADYDLTMSCACHIKRDKVVHCLSH